MTHIKYLNDLQSFLDNMSDEQASQVFKTIAIQLLSSCKENSKDIPNIMLHGKDEFIKDHYIHKLIEHLHGGVYKRCKDKPRTCYIDETQYKNKAKYVTSTYYLRVDMDVSNLNDKSSAINLLKNLTMNRSIDNNRLIIILDRVDTMPINTDYALRKILEQPNILFILNARNINKVDFTLYSRCLSVNLNINMQNFIRMFCLLNNIECDKHINSNYDDIVSFVIRLSCDNAEYANHIYSYISNYFTSTIPLFIKNDIACITNAKQCANKLHSACVPIHIIAKHVVQYLKDNQYSAHHFYNALELLAEHDTKSKQVNKLIFVYESLFFRLAQILSFSSKID